MANCYPTGCPPCTEPIDFPENPADGDRYCVPIGKEGETKCWVWDACVPAWRAEGPSQSSSRFRGSLDPNKSEKDNGITDDGSLTDLAPGDWWIVTVDTNVANHPDFNKDLLGVDLEEGDRVYWNGEAYEKLPPPIIPYAEEAEDDTPDPDNRIGGIVKTASVEEAQEGLNKCNQITPYTLAKTVTGFGTVTNGTVEIIEGDTMVCVEDKLLVLNALAISFNDDNEVVLTSRTFKWFRDGVEVANTRETIGGANTNTLTIEDYTTNNIYLTEQFTCEVTFKDAFANEVTVTSNPVTVGFQNQLKIDAEPQSRTLTAGGSTTFQFSVSQDPSLTQISPINYQWEIDDVPITGPNSPNVGYTFVDWNTKTLTVTESSADGNAGNYVISCEVTSSSPCSPNLHSANAILNGPGGEGDVINQITNNSYATVPTTYGAVGTYTIVQARGNVGSEIGGFGIPPGRWRCMGSWREAASSGSGFNYGGAYYSLIVRFA